MISKIDISQFGLFNNHSWDTSVGKDETFRKLNIIYGRNYTGKTTLARIFKCFEDGLMHKHYSDCCFSITMSDGKVITSSNLIDFALHNLIRVYNTDFIRENLSWLHNDDGSIKPFTILGSQNIEIEKQIKAIQERLGSVEKACGLFFKKSNAETTLEEKKTFLNTISNQFEEKLRKRANDKIKIDRNLFIATAFKKSYTINDLKDEIGTIINNVNQYLLSNKATEDYVKLLDELPLNDIPLLTEAKPNFSGYYNECSEIVTRKIKPSKPIIDLINDSLLQEWVRDGIDKHKGKRVTCGFCGGNLNDDLWNKLDAHFSKESEKIRIEIRQKIANLQNSKKALEGFITLNKEVFYQSLQPQFEEFFKDWLFAKDNYNTSISELIEGLQDREKDIFKDSKLPDIKDHSEPILNTIKNFNILISNHNKKTKSLSIDQSAARKKLRFNNIAQFLIDINYDKDLEIIKRAKEDYELFKVGIIALTEEISKLVEEGRILETQSKDESRGAELVNQHLTHFFGHNELKLIAEGSASNIKFVIHREGQVAKNLSEGESSLISFCYFIAKIEDQLKDQVTSQKLIIYIDDPISSLDSNHIFFMFSLIESVIAGPKKYCQLFISTHNLDFLKYLKRLTFPRYKPNENSNSKKSDLKYFIIERKNKSNSYLKLAPDYLKDYITEFNFLFDQIYQCSILGMDQIKVNYQYNFGNNMRKFLEAYLFYKYPSHKITQDEKLRKYFENDNVTINLINRVVNEYSHIGEQFDRGMEPVDVDEIKKISTAVINKIKSTDPGQYDALFESVQSN